MEYLRISDKNNYGVRKVWFSLDAKHETYISVTDTETIDGILERVHLCNELYITGGLSDLWHDDIERK